MRSRHLILVTLPELLCWSTEAGGELTAGRREGESREGMKREDLSGSGGSEATGEQGREVRVSTGSE
ncbi:hypothetical protein O3P69_000917 [Scylla paramamosain]|uniref:Uncharacterized protein n=1 Tax=Scylla paramamosain TaxID=85552 RepID=A0AAW0UUW2_SCYPA